MRLAVCNYQINAYVWVKILEGCPLEQEINKAIRFAQCARKDGFYQYADIVETALKKGRSQRQLRSAHS